MGHRYKVTNISDAPVFIAEAGRLIQPKYFTTAGRLDEPTKKDPRLQIEEGDFELQGAPAKITTDKQRYEDEDEDEVVPAKVADAKDPGPAMLVPATRQSRVIPLEAAPSTPAASTPAMADNDDDAPLAKDELDDEIPKADKFVAKDTEADEAGFVTRKALPTEPLVGR